MAISEIFTEFLFGSGAWLGLILIETLIILGGWKNKWLALVFIMISVFFGVTYLDNVAASDIFMWGAIIMLALNPVILVFRMIERND